LKAVLVVLGCAAACLVAAWGGLALFFPTADLDSAGWVLLIAFLVGAIGGVVWRLTRRSRPGAAPVESGHR
jgi:hypothetical protein